MVRLSVSYPYRENAEWILAVRLWSLEYLGTLESVLVVRFWSLEKL